MRSLLFVSCVAAGALACGPATTTGDDDDDNQVVDASPQPDRWPGPAEFADAAPAEACEKMDILFVIDNSGSMDEEQTNLIFNFPLFANLIDEYVTTTGAALDYRIAVTTAGRDVSYTLGTPLGDIPFTEGGDNGVFRGDCGLANPWIERGNANVADAFSCIADVGTGGPGAEMPLLGMEWSLNRRVADGTNAGFLRDDALLAVVFITDQDDCSREDDDFWFSGLEPTCYIPSEPSIIPLEYYLNFLDALKGERGRWAASVIAGTGPGACESSFGNAAEAVRMLDFAEQAGDNTVVSSICHGDLTGALEDALDQFEASCNSFPPVE